MTRWSLACVALMAVAAWSPASATAEATCPNAAIRSEQGSTSLPDCRAYELVTPPDKNGGFPTADASRTRAAVEGGAVSFASLTAFGDAVGTGIATDYIAERAAGAAPGSDAWSVRAITPAQKTQILLGASGAEPRFVTMTPDLSRGVFQAWSPLTEDSYVNSAINLYTRSDLRSPGAGAFRLDTSCTRCEQETQAPLAPLDPEVGLGLPVLAAITADASEVLFESSLQLAPGSNASLSPYRSNLFLSREGETRLVGLVPLSGRRCVDPECIVPAAGSRAGNGLAVGPTGLQKYAPHVLSANGDAAIFTVPEGGLYRRNFTSVPESTTRLDFSERTVPDPPSPSNLPTYWDAATDGSRVFFSSEVRLTDAEGSGLYVWSEQPDAEGHHLTLIGPGASTVFGVSADGSSAYFGASQQLVEGGPAIPPGATGIFLWREGADGLKDGELRYIGRLTFEQDVQANEAGGSIGLQNNNGSAALGQSRVTPDGRYFLFVSTSGAGLLSLYGGADYNQGECATLSARPTELGCRQLYLYDAATGQLRCISCRADGGPAKGNALTWVLAHQGASLGTTYVSRSFTDDERHIFFTTNEALAEEDTNGTYDAYEYGVETGEVRLLSSGTSPQPSYFLDSSANGSDVFIATAQSLTGWDTDDGYDLYDVRVDGGFAEPPPSLAPCNGESCRPAASRPPAAPSALSASLQGQGNVGTAKKRRHIAQKHRKLHRKRKHRNRHNRHDGLKRGQR